MKNHHIASNANCDYTRLMYALHRCHCDRNFGRSSRNKYCILFTRIEIRNKIDETNVETRAHSVCKYYHTFVRLLRFVLCRNR